MSPYDVTRPQCDKDANCLYFCLCHVCKWNEKKNARIIGTVNILICYIVKRYIDCISCLICHVIYVYQFNVLFTVFELSVAEVCAPGVLLVIFMYQCIALYWAYVRHHSFFIKVLRPDETGRYFADDIFICICSTEHFSFVFKFYHFLFPRVRLTIDE